MRATDDKDTPARIRAELERTRSEVHALLDSLSDEDFRKPSLNPGWTNGEVLFHMTLAFMIVSSLITLSRFRGRLARKHSRRFAAILNSATGFFNWVNALGARGGGRIYDRKRIRNKFDAVCSSLLKRLDRIPQADWRRGMHYPTHWDALFSDYMTLEELFHYPTAHFEFHRNQISR